MPQAPQAAVAPPEIPGYSYVRPVGHGGFSDVYLYEQLMPRRQVAIKVLRTDDLSEGIREQFAAEANLMARVSNHSNIAAIYAADVDDDGQPYLVMEYCSGGSLGAFYRNFPLSVKDVLSLGIRLCGGLEAAHRAGIVHRDVKPANILLTEYGVPVLSDFGISTIDEELPEATRKNKPTGTTGSGESSVGMSLPWAAPETLWDEPVSDARSDRYSLAATFYSLLEGHSPHEVPGGPNSAAHVAGRIQSGFRAAMRRPDVPASLQEVLRKGLSHDRAARYSSTAEIGRALQAVQRELGFEVTPLEVPREDEIAKRPPAVGTTVQQSQPIQLPAGHATLFPGSETGAANGAWPPASQPAQPNAMFIVNSAPSSMPTQGIAQGWTASPPRPWDLPPGIQVAPPSAVSGAQAGRSERQGPRWRLIYGVVIAVLLLGCVVVASLLIARANAEPTYTGPAIDSLDVQRTDAGIYEVAIPPALDVPAAVEIRVLEVGAGDGVTDSAYLTVSSDTATWSDGETRTLDPLQTENSGNSSFVAASEVAATLGVDPSTLHVGDVILVAAPEGYFSNLHPDLGINFSEATLVILQISDVS